MPDAATTTETEAPDEELEEEFGDKPFKFYALLFVSLRREANNAVKCFVACHRPVYCVKFRQYRVLQRFDLGLPRLVVRGRPDGRLLPALRDRERTLLREG